MTGYAAHYKNQYRDNYILTASREQILIALYDGAIRFCAQAREAIESKNFGLKGEKIDRVMAIIGELNATLDHEKAPEVCGNLMRLYNYMMERLGTSSIEMSVGPLDEVVDILKRLRQTWSEAIEAARDDLAAAA